MKRKFKDTAQTCFRTAVLLFLAGFLVTACSGGGSGGGGDDDGDGGGDAGDDVVYETFMNFDDLPVTGENEIPGSSDTWIYTTGTENPVPGLHMTAYDVAGWRSTDVYDGDTYNFINIGGKSPYNTDHMGFTVFNYFEIVQSPISGNCLVDVVTGGVNNSTTKEELGLELYKKQTYLDYLREARDPVAHGEVVGSPYIWIKNNSGNGIGNGAVGFREAQGKNRFSFYYYVPEYPGASFEDDSLPQHHFHVYNANSGNHYYHYLFHKRGCWVHVLIDRHPTYNNSGNSAYDFPDSKAFRTKGEDYFNNDYRMAMAIIPYGGISEPVHKTYYDEFEFRKDDEAQNEETIVSLGIGYYKETKVFQVFFHDKYMGMSGSGSEHETGANATYELRYSFSQITNDNWADATPVHIVAHPERYISARTDGKFQKRCYDGRNVWAPFKLATDEDMDRLQPGTVVYFAVKDISQQDVTGKKPVDILDDNLYWAVKTGGRDYEAAEGMDFYDYETDKESLPLIKRTEYVIPE